MLGVLANGVETIDVPFNETVPLIAASAYLPRHEAVSVPLGQMGFEYVADPLYDTGAAAALAEKRSFTVDPSDRVTVPLSAAARSPS